MTRTYALKRLLEHGELSFAEIKEITGWSKSIAWRALSRLIEQKKVERMTKYRYGHFFYKLP